MNYLGIEIGGSKLQMVTGTGDGGILDSQRLEVNRSRGGTGIREQMKAVIQKLQPQFKWSAIGAGYGGPIDWKTGRICCSHHIQSWDEFPLGEWLRELTALPVVVDNDTNVAAFGEAQCGAGVGYDPVFYTNSGSGVGGGLVTNGKIYHGSKPGESEFGHLRLDKHGTIVEERCSGWAVNKKVRNLAGSEPGSVLAQLAADAKGCEARVLAPALNANCPLALQIVDQTAEEFAFALSHVVHLVHPQAIVLGGGLALIGEPWRQAVASSLPRFVMKAFAPGPEVLLAGLGENSVPVGALLLAGLMQRNLL